MLLRDAVLADLVELRRAQDGVEELPPRLDLAGVAGVILITNFRWVDVQPRQVLALGVLVDGSDVNHRESARCRSE